MAFNKDKEEPKGQGIYSNAGIRILEDGRVEAYVIDPSNPQIETRQIMPADMAAACIFDDVAAPLLAATKAKKPFRSQT